MIILVLDLTACEKSHSVNTAGGLSDEYVIEHYTVDFPNYENLETEIYYVECDGSDMSAGKFSVTDILRY